MYFLGGQLQFSLNPGTSGACQIENQLPDVTAFYFFVSISIWSSCALSDCYFNLLSTLHPTLDLLAVLYLTKLLCTSARSHLFNLRGNSWALEAKKYLQSLRAVVLIAKIHLSKCSERYQCLILRMYHLPLYEALDL